MRGALSPARHNVSVGALAWRRSAAPWSRARDEEIAVPVLDRVLSRIGVELGCARDRPCLAAITGFLRFRRLRAEAAIIGRLWRREGSVEGGVD
jgi:hypothetical protein